MLLKDFASPESTSLTPQGRCAREDDLNRPSHVLYIYIYIWMQNTNHLSLGHHKRGLLLGCLSPWGTADAETAEPPSTQVIQDGSKDGFPKIERKKSTQLPQRLFKFDTRIHFQPKPLKITFQWSFFFLEWSSHFGWLFFFPKASSLNRNGRTPHLSALPFRRWFHRVRHNVHTMEVMIYQRWAASIETGGKFGGTFFLGIWYSEGYE